MLNGLAEVEPIITHEQLFDAVAQAVDGIHSAMELERIVDGISRFADRRPTGLPRRTRTLVRRMLSRSQKGLGTWATPRSMVQLVHLWLTGTRCEMRCQPPTGPDRSIDLRLAELSARVEHGVAGPLLATPTHEYGWLAPRRLVERMHQLHELGLHPPQLDLIQGLLRLAPDGREEALSAAADLPGKAGVVVRWALGGQEAPSTEWAGAWLAAGRGRTPRGVIEPLVLTGLSDEVPDGITPARYRWVAHGEKRTGQQRIRLSISPSDRSGLDEAAFPIQALHAGISQRRRPTVFMPGFMRQWRASIWPGNPDPHLAGLIQRLMGRIDCNATSLEPSRSYLEPLFQPDRNWSALGLLVLGIAMVGKDTDLRGVAVEALHGAVVDGRAQPRQLSGTLLQLMGGGWVKLNRLADALRRLSDISALTSWFSVCILDALIVSGDELPRDAHHLLELWLELLGKLGLLPSQQAQDKLRRLRGSSKTAQLGRAILAQSEASDARGRARVELEFLAGRLERTGRCSGSY